MYRKSPHHHEGLKLHIASIKLLINSSINNQIGIQAIQSKIPYEQVKAVITSAHAPYKVKRVYLKFIFEIYLNKIAIHQILKLDHARSQSSKQQLMTSSTRKIQLQQQQAYFKDIQEILSNEILPVLDTKNIYQYLEGLIKLPKKKAFDMNKQITDNTWVNRKGIINLKVQYFKDYPEFASLVQNDLKVNQTTDEELKKKVYKCVVSDPQEFWKYIMEDGVIHYISDTYIENYDVYQGIESILDDYSFIKKNLQKLQSLFDKFVNDSAFNYKDKEQFIRYKSFLSLVHHQLPEKSVEKSGKNFRIMVGQDQVQESLGAQCEVFDEVKDPSANQQQNKLDENTAQKGSSLDKYLLRYHTHRTELVEYIKQLHQGEAYGQIQQLKAILCNSQSVRLTETEVAPLFRKLKKEISDSQEVDGGGNREEGQQLQLQPLQLQLPGQE